MSILLFLHVLAMFIGFALTTGTGIFMSVVVENGEVDVVRAATRVNRRLATIGGISMLVGLVLGFGVAGEAGYSMTATWLVATYILVVVLLVLAFGVLRPYGKRLSAAAEASGAQPSAEMQALLASPAPRIAGPLSGLLWIAIIAMMVLKP